MSLRRLSVKVDNQKLPERMGPPISSGRKNTNSLVMFSKHHVPNMQPVRLHTPKPFSSKIGSAKRTTVSSIQVHKTTQLPMPGPSRQLIQTSPVSKKCMTDELDGITVLPPTSAEKPVLRSVTKKQEGMSQIKSRIPRSSGSKVSKNGINKRKSTVVAKKRLTMPRRETVKMPLNPRLEALAHPSSPSSRSFDSTAQFEADERDTEMPTPAPSYMKHSACHSSCSVDLQEMKKLNKELIASQAEFLNKQTENLDKQNKLIEKQTEVLIKLHKFLDEKIKIVKSHTNLNDMSVDSSDDEKENGCKIANSSVIGQQAIMQYNDIRSGFNFLSLKTPARDQGFQSTAVTPKTPKSLLSRTLQMQLGDLFEES